MLHSTDIRLHALEMGNIWDFECPSGYRDRLDRSEGTRIFAIGSFDGDEDTIPFPFDYDEVDTIEIVFEDRGERVDLRDCLERYLALFPTNAAACRPDGGSRDLLISDRSTGQRRRRKNRRFGRGNRIRTS